MRADILAAIETGNPVPTSIPTAGGAVRSLPSLPLAGPLGTQPLWPTRIFGALALYREQGAPLGVDLRQSDFGVLLGLTGDRLAARIVARRVKLSFAFPWGAGEVTVRALLDGHTIEERTARGKKTVTVSLAHDAITGVFVSAGKAVLTDIEIEPVVAAGGWALLTPEPLRLPVHHADYDGQAADLQASEGEALARVVYGDGEEWRGERFQALHALLLKLVTAGAPLDQRVLTNVAAQAPGGPATVDRYSVVDWLRLSLLDPALAQMLGFYFLDRTADPATSYDYLVLGWYGTEVTASWLSKMVQSASWLPGSGMGDGPPYDAWLCSNVSLQGPSLAVPASPRAFALPTPQGAGRVGLQWDAPGARPHSDWLEDLFPFRPLVSAGAPAQFRLWQCFMGNPEEPQLPALSDYQLLDARFLTGSSTGGGSAGDAPIGWPPVRLRAFGPPPREGDSVDEGWYSYRLAAVNLLGQSRTSGPASWWQWAPPPEPEPWYYDAAVGEGVIHPFAVRLLEKDPPPAPEAVSATLIDPRDPYRVAGAAFDAWRAALPPGAPDDLCALRVSWEWTLEQRRAAPDLREFRVYLRHGRAPSRPVPWEERIHVHPADGPSVQGCRPRLDGLVAEGAQATVNGLLIALGPGGDLAGVLPGVDRLFLKSGSQETSSTITHVDPAHRRVRVRRLPGETSYSTWRIGPDEGEVPLDGIADVVAGDSFVVPGSANLSNIRPGTDVLWLAAAAPEPFFEIVEVDRAARRITLGGRPLPAGPTAWAIGTGYDRYEIFLPPAAQAASSLLAEPSVTEGKSVAQVGVSAADDKAHTPDDPRWNGTPHGGRHGNEGPVAGPREVYRVRRTLPGAPEDLDYDSDALRATPADYHGRSFCTVRWKYQEGFLVHVYRASDESVFLADWKSRRPRAGWDDGDPALPAGWAGARKEAVADELSALDALLAALPPPPPDAPPSAGAVAALAIYRSQKLSNDALRALASQSAVARAFRQITMEPLDQQAAEHQDHIGPEDPDAYPPHGELRAFRDTLDGRSKNRYFYRVAFVDVAQNRGAFGRASVPVYLPEVVPPRAPAVMEIMAGDPDEANPQENRLTLSWAPNREPNLAEYRVYRANDEPSSRDVRRMQLVHTLANLEADPLLRPRPTLWTDVVPDRSVYWYRIVALSASGIPSAASTPLVGRAFSDPRPEHPTWQPPAVDLAAGTVTLSWTSADPELRCLVQ
ncbi:MAG: hypothetical protein R3B70_38170, partial [Polyangiaceae bacterium]